jgi:elongation factor P--beta-lysine ligase
MRKAIQKENREAQAFAEETEHLLEQKGRMAAWDEVHPLPKVTAPPEIKPGESVHRYLRARAAQAAPLALERVIRRALLNPGISGDAAADNILDRVGFSRKSEPTIENNGPVFIVNFDPSRIPLLAQQAQVAAGTFVEGEVVSTTQTGETDDQQIHGDQKTRNQMGDPERDD